MASVNYVCKEISKEGAYKPRYLKFNPYGVAKDIDDADKFKTKKQAFAGYLDCFRHPEDYEKYILSGEIIAEQTNQLELKF